MKSTIFGFLLIGVCTMCMQGQDLQQVITPGVLNSSTTNSQLNSVVGQVASSTSETTLTILTQGFLQPFNTDSMVNPGINTPEDWNISFYPNPTHEKVFVNFIDGIEGDYRLSVLDLSGRELLMMNGNAQPNSNIEVDFAQITNGTYFIKITTTKNEEKLVQVIKN